MADETRRFYGVQFHPEVTHTLQGARMLERFVREICGCEARWEPGNIIADAIARVREQVGGDRVLLGLSGGVDSSVVAALLHRAIGDQLVCVFVDHGLLRAGEGDQVMETLGQTHGRARDPGQRGAAVPRRAALASRTRSDKRKIIGRLFVEVFERGGAQARRRALARAGHDLSGRDRIGRRARPARRTSSSRITTSAACRSR